MATDLSVAENVAAATETTAANKLPTLEETINALMAAMGSVFTGVAANSMTTDGKLDITHLPAVLEKAADLLRDTNPGSGVNDAVTVAGHVEETKVEEEGEEDIPSSAIVFEDEWKLAISKATGKVLGIFPDNALAQRWFSDEAEEEIASKNALSSYDSAVQRCREQVELIIKECRRTNKKFRDEDFALDSQALCIQGLDQRTDYGFLPQGFAQTRKIFKKPQFYVNGATASDIKQGEVGDCWFLAGIAALTNFKACLTQNYVQVDGDEKVGVYGFVFHRDGEWIYEIVDDFLYVKNPKYGPMTSSRKDDSLEWTMLNRLSEQSYNATFTEGSNALYFAQSRDENETWLPLLEKAFAKAHGDYWAINGGFTGEAIEDLTGGITTEIRTEDILDPDILWDELLLCNEQFIFGCWTPRWDNGDVASQGLFSGHAYSIMKAVVTEVNGKFERLLLVRNPWGQSEWTGAFSDGSKEMTPSLLTKLGHETGDDGMFYMSFDDFLRKFELIDRIRLIGNDWSCAQCWTNLKIPRTKTFLDTKYVFNMDRADQVVLSLSQLDDRYIRGLTGQYWFELEFRVEKAEADSTDKIIARSTRGINTTRSVNAEVYLEKGKYNVFLKITAHYKPDETSMKDTIKTYVESNKYKLIQIAKKYNFAHMKQGVGDKNDRIFESLTVENTEESVEAPSPQDENHEKETKVEANFDGHTPTDSTPKPVDTTHEMSPETPVENPVTEEPKPSTIETKNKPKEKKDKSIENWNPVATVGLRLFTRKAKVILSVVQENTGGSVLVEGGAINGKPARKETSGPTILVSGESARIGNVPPIGDPLPVTPQPAPASKSDLVEDLKLDTLSINGLLSPTAAKFDDSKAFVLLSRDGATVLTTSASQPVAITTGGVKEGAEKAEDTKSPVDLRTSREAKVRLGQDSAVIKEQLRPLKTKPRFVKVKSVHICPETLDTYGLPWEWAPDNEYILVSQWIPEDDREVLFEHTRLLRERSGPQSSVTKPNTTPDSKSEITTLPSKQHPSAAKNPTDEPTTGKIAETPRVSISVPPAGAPAVIGESPKNEAQDTAVPVSTVPTANDNTDSSSQSQPDNTVTPVTGDELTASPSSSPTEPSSARAAGADGIAGSKTDTGSSLLGVSTTPAT